MQKIPNLFLLVDRYDQLAYFSMLTPHNKIEETNMLVSLCYHWKTLKFSVGFRIRFWEIKWLGHFF